MAVLLRIAWRSVSGIVTRVVTERAGAVDRLAGLRRIGIDEISSWRRHHRYLTLVADHTGKKIVWGAEGKDTDHPGRVLRRARTRAQRCT